MWLCEFKRRIDILETLYKENMYKEEQYISIKSRGEKEIEPQRHIIKIMLGSKGQFLE